MTLALVLTTLSASALPAKRGQWKTVRLADGTEVRAELRGNAFLNYWQTADGLKLVENAKTGLYEQADMEQLRAKAEKMRAPLKSVRKNSNGPAKTPIGGDHEPYIGKKKGLIILVEFADKQFMDIHTPDLFRRIANEENFTNEMGFIGSVSDYFKAQSYGQFELDFDVVGPVRMPHGYAHYGENVYGANSNPIEIVQMVIDACTAVDGEVDFKDYDWDGDGEVDQVFLLYAGHGEASYSKDPNTIWQHESSIERLSQAVGQPKSLKLDGVKIDTYACSSELGSQESIDGIGSICHEFAHCLGLPDMYDTNGGGNYGMGDWSLMCSGNYNGNSFVPAALTAYERMYAGWLTPKELNDDVAISNMGDINGDGEAYIIYNDGNRNEYYLLENRQKTGWDAELPGTGLLITHVDFNAAIWGSNSVNALTRQRCTVFFANNDRYDQSGHTYPYEGNNSLTNTSTPAATVYNKNIDGTNFMNKAVKNITRSGDGKISFVFDANKSTDDYDVPNTYAFYESFDKMDGKGGNDNLFTGSTVGKGTFKGNTDMDGWSSTSGHGADKCAMLGSSTMAGQITTPAIELNGEYYLQFKVAPYTGDGTNLTVEIAEGNGTLAKSEFIMTAGKWSAFKTTVTANGAIKIRFKSSKKRFFLDKVCIASDLTGINDAVTDFAKPQNNRIYTIGGQYVGTDFNALGKGIYIVNGKKVVK